MDNSDFYIYVHRAEDEANRSRRHADDSNIGARRAESFADDARRYAASAKDSVLIVQELASSVEGTLKQIEARFNEVRGLKSEQVKQLRSDLKASEMRELKCLKLMRELEKTLLMLSTPINSADVKNETQAKNQAWAGPTVEKLESVDCLKPRSRVS
jgi:hypothetical protein